MKLALGLPGNFQDDGAKRVGVCFASNTDLELWTEEVMATVCRPRGVRAPQGPHACGGPARVADGQAVGRALRGAPPHARAPGP